MSGMYVKMVKWFDRCASKPDSGFDSWRGREFFSSELDIIFFSFEVVNFSKKYPVMFIKT